MREVLNQERGSDIGIELVPADDFGDLAEPTDETEITLREGLTRRIQRESQAADARTWAFARATIAGRGFYGVMTRYVPGKTNDQEIYIHRYYNQACVTLDPAHEQPDGSDAEWGFIGTDLPWSRYKVEYPKRNGKRNALITDADGDDAWRQLGDEQPDWFRGEGEKRFVRVVDYFYTERTARQLCTLADGTLAWEDEAPDGAEIVDERTVIEKSIKWAKIDGSDDDVLEETDWPGPDMPIVKVLGEELQPYDEERRAEGMVRPMREPGQSYNVMVSKMVELIGLTPIPPVMMAEGQDEGLEAEWDASTTRTIGRLHYKQTDLADRPAVPPFTTPRDPQIQPVVAAVAMFDDALQSVSVSDPATGHTDSSVKSAKHANLLREQANQSTSNYLDNLMRSMRYEGQIINGLLYPIYGRRPGRLARIINGQGEPETLLIGTPMVSQGGRPVPASDPNAPDAKRYALTPDAKLNVGIKITKNFDFRREQEAATVGDLISANPALMTWFGDLYFKNLDGPGHDEMADRTKVMLDPRILQMLDSKKQGVVVPPQVQAQLAQAQQQVQQLTQVAQQQQQQLQTDAAKEQAETQRVQMKLAADLELAKVKAQADLQKAQMDNAARIEIARITAAKEAANIAKEAAEERLSTGLQVQAQQAHEAGMAAMGQAHDSTEAGVARDAQATEAERARQAAAQQAAQEPA